MSDIVSCTIIVYEIINERINTDLYSNLEACHQAAQNVINQFNNHQISHWAELPYRDRASFINNAISGYNQDQDVNIRIQHIDRTGNSARIYENRLITERLENWARMNNLNAEVLERANISDPRSDTFKAAQDVLVNRSYALNRSLLRNSRAASQLQNCSTRTNTITSHLESLQDSVD